jgi:hypothetical protein
MYVGDMTHDVGDMTHVDDSQGYDDDLHMSSRDDDAYVYEPLLMYVGDMTHVCRRHDSCG